MEWIEEGIVPIVAIIAVFTWLALRHYWNYRRDKSLIEKGLYEPKPPEKPPETSKTPGEVLQEAAPAILMAGLIVIGMGAAILVGFGLAGVSRLWLLGGLIPCFIGIALAASYIVIRKK